MSPLPFTATAARSALVTFEFVMVRAGGKRPRTAGGFILCDGVGDGGGIVGGGGITGVNVAVAVVDDDGTIGVGVGTIEAAWDVDSVEIGTGDSDRRDCDELDPEAEAADEGGIGPGETGIAGKVFVRVLDDSD